jgi:hypothetical protein
MFSQKPKYAASGQLGQTRKDSLTQTWVDNGPGFFAYTRVQESLERRGGTFIDYTVNGALPLPKSDLNKL